MAISFDHSGTKYIKWTAPSGVVGVTSKTIHLWYKPTALVVAGCTLWTIFDGTGTDSDEYNYIAEINGKLEFLAHFSTTNGVWDTTNVVLSAGTLACIQIVYDGSATGNNPTIYVNGTSVAVTRTTAPVGTYRSGVSTDLYIGTPAAGLNPNGSVQDNRIYTGAISAARLAALAGSSRTIEMDDSSLLFHTPLMYAAALYPTIPFAGILSGTSYTYDRINGVQGVPSGSPSGAADLVYGSAF